MPLAFFIVGLGGWLYYEVQISLINAVDRPSSQEMEIAVTQLRIDTVRNTLTMAVGLGGAAALVLSFRRQQYEEYHGMQQRITELRIQAVAQLGSESPTVRIGGLHNLERLGEQHEELRQIVLDEICSYLRLPHSAINTNEEQGSDSLAAAYNADREVRIIAQEILQRKLREDPVSGKLNWDHARLNLKNSVLKDIDFSFCQLNNADFTNTKFEGNSIFMFTSFRAMVTSFNQAKFSGGAVFMSARFFPPGKVYDEPLTRADFSEAKFDRSVSFDSAEIIGTFDVRRANFKRASFADLKIRLPENEYPPHISVPRGWKLVPRNDKELPWGFVEDDTSSDGPEQERDNPSRPK